MEEKKEEQTGTLKKDKTLLRDEKKMEKLKQKLHTDDECEWGVGGREGTARGRGPLPGRARGKAAVGGGQRGQRRKRPLPSLLLIRQLVARRRGGPSPSHQAFCFAGI